jgi:hypothetical protein
MTFLCTIYNHDYTFGPAGEPTPAGVTLVGQAAVRAGSARAAAAKGYVRCVGRPRARLLAQLLPAGAVQRRHETDWRAIAPGLMRSSGRMGDCYCFDNLVEAWYIQVVPAAVPLPAKRLRHPPRHFLSGQNPSPN